MAKAPAKGRPIVPLELSAEERAYLERQVRRHRAVRSLSERCRIILCRWIAQQVRRGRAGATRTHGWQMAAPLPEGSLRPTKLVLAGREPSMTIRLRP